MSGLPARFAACVFGMLTMLFVVAAAAQVKPYPAWRAGLPVGAFTAIAGTAQMSGQTSNSAVVNAWNGLAACGSTWYSMLSGGHADSTENRVYALDLANATPAWVMLNAGSAAPTPTNTLYYDDGLPASRHTYYTTQCVASRNRVMTFSAFAANIHSVGGPVVDGFDLGTRIYDPAGTWPNVPFFMRVSSVATDPRTGAVYVAGDYKFAKWDAANGAWTSIVPSGIGPWAWSWEFKGSFIDIRRNKWIELSGNLLRIDLSTNAADAIIVSGPLAGASDNYSSTVHDTDNDRYLTIKGTTLYAIDPVTGVSTALATVSTAVNGVNNRIAYFADLGGFAYLPSFASSVLFMPMRADPPPPGDTTPPTVVINAPASGDTVSSVVTVAASASDDTGVAGVRFEVNGNSLGAEDTTAPYAVAWDTTAFATGTHVLAAFARDAAGNTATSTVTVSNAPPALTTSRPTHTGLTATAATITWTTNVPATGVVRYGLATGALTSTSSQTALGTTHSVILTGLAPKTRYYYQVAVRAPDGSTGSSPVQFFNTKPK